MLSRIFSFLLPTLVVVVGFIAVLSLAGDRLPPESAMAGLSSPSGLSAVDLRRVNLKGVVLPRPEISPREVVELQLAGLSDQKANGVGILQCYCFASPANRAMTGPLERFGRMVRQAPYQSMAHPRAVLIGAPQHEGQVCRLLVTIVDEGEQVCAFTFVLARQDEPPFRDCWMTEAVFPTLPMPGADDPPTEGKLSDAA